MKRQGAAESARRRVAPRRWDHAHAARRVLGTGTAAGRRRRGVLRVWPRGRVLRYAIAGCPSVRADAVSPESAASQRTSGIRIGSAVMRPARAPTTTAMTRRPSPRSTATGRASGRRLWPEVSVGWYGGPWRTDRPHPRVLETGACCDKRPAGDLRSASTGQLPRGTVRQARAEERSTSRSTWPRRSAQNPAGRRGRGRVAAGARLTEAVRHRASVHRRGARGRTQPRRPHDRGSTGAVLQHDLAVARECIAVRHAADGRDVYRLAMNFYPLAPDRDGGGANRITDAVTSPADV